MVLGNELEPTLSLVRSTISSLIEQKAPQEKPEVEFHSFLTNGVIIHLRGSDALDRTITATLLGPDGHSPRDVSESKLYVEVKAWKNYSQSGDRITSRLHREILFGVEPPFETPKLTEALGKAYERVSALTESDLDFESPLPERVF